MPAHVDDHLLEVAIESSDHHSDLDLVTTAAGSMTANSHTSDTTVNTAPQSHEKASRTLACRRCHDRKLGCDRQQPCSRCKKANTPCESSKQLLPRRRRRRPQEELLQRVEKLEKLLLQSTQGNAKVEAQTSTPVGTVIEEAGNARFIDNSFRLSFYHDLVALKKDIEDEQEYASAPASNPSGFSLDLFPGVDGALALDLQQLQPDYASAFKLWQVFRERVNPLTKIVHIPSLESYVAEAATDMDTVPMPFQALIFSIYAMAVVSLTEPEVVSLIGITRADALSRFGRATKHALTRAGYLETYDMTILQALLFYTLAMHWQTEHHTNWITGGMIIRMAQKMGYHRDGEKLELSPFETEMRRRLWWHILVQDSQNAMLSGMSQSWCPTNWGTKLPLNVDDSDMLPDSAEPLVPRDGPTDMAFVLMLHQYVRFVLESNPKLDAAFSLLRDGIKDGDQEETHAGQATQNAVDIYRGLVRDFDSKLAIFEERYVDRAAGGVQEAALMVRPLLVGKLKSIVTPMREHAEFGTEVTHPADSLFKSFIYNQKQNEPYYRRLHQLGFLWFRQNSFPHEALINLTRRLRKKPTEPLTAEAWNTLKVLHELHPDLNDLSQKRSLRQAKLTLRAWDCRERALKACGQQPEVPRFIQRLREFDLSPRVNASLGGTRSRLSPVLAPPQYPMPQAQMPSFEPLPAASVDMYPALGRHPDMADPDVDMWEDLPLLDPGTDFQQEQDLTYNIFDFCGFGYPPQNYFAG
ncbi:fungal-specific transcription factor domain-containing protein [Xylariaceae sp. FL0594]|nr:fungal-specific transcription factor domain-containing protein [Xylariaceae sp. FL0594]